MINEWLLLIAGFVLLVGGAELLIRGASHLASALGLSPLIIGLTVVAFGTSAPELAINVRSAFEGKPDLALGNIVGSNIFNILFILGVSALVTPLVVKRQLVRLDVPIMIVVSLVVFFLGVDGHIGQLEGALLVSALVVYIVWSIRTGRREPGEGAKTRAIPPSVVRRPRVALMLNIALVIVGLILLTVGSQLLVQGAVSVARLLGVSELIIGLTIVAVGTSLPEVATSVLAAVKGERDIAVGNVVGSNIFNLLGVLGLTSAVAPGGVVVSRAAVAFDLPVMVAVAIACFPIFVHEYRINRWEGALFLAYYGAYLTYLVLNATGHDLLQPFSRIMLDFVIPLTGLTLVTLVIRSWRRNRTSNVSKPS